MYTSKQDADPIKRLGLNIRKIYDETLYNCRTHEFLYKPFEQGLFSIPDVIGYLRTISTSVEQYYYFGAIPMWLFNRNKTYSIPQKEISIIRHLSETNRAIRRLGLENVDIVTNEDVWKKDAEQIKEYERFKMPAFNQINLDKLQTVSDKLYSHFGDIGRTLTFDEALETVQTDKSSCYPEFGRKGDLNIIERARQEVEQIFSVAQNESVISVYKILVKLYTCVFHRFQTKLKQNARGKVFKDTKIRQVFGSPYVITLLESMLFEKAIKSVMRHKYFSYNVTRPDVSRQIASIRAAASIRGKVIYCGDITSIDSHHSVFSIIYLFNMLSQLCNWNTAELRIVKALLMYHVVTPITWNKRRLSFALGGNKSGSKFTSILNSVIVCLIIAYHNYVFHGEIPEENELFVLGDDFIYACSSEDKAKLVQTFKYFGFTLNETKTEVVDALSDILYLGFYWNIRNEPSNPDLWWIAKVCFPERFVKTSGWGRILSRICSIVFQLHNGFDIFKEILVGKLRRYVSHLGHPDNIKIQYYDASGFEQYDTLPLSVLLTEGWRAF
jgi:hypothetical protein